MTDCLRAMYEGSFRTGLLYLFLTLLLLLPGSGTIPLMDRDEPRFAQATEEMRQSGERVVPYFNGEFRFVTARYRSLVEIRPNPVWSSRR